MTKTSTLYEAISHVWKNPDNFAVTYFILGAMAATRFTDPLYEELDFLYLIVRTKEELFGTAM